MKKRPLRIDKTCLNCDHPVEERFCPGCGQENIETHQSFYHIFIHFFNDLTHYDNKFWRTIYNLLFKPASLSIAYASGKRLRYLNPFRLYLFISFITFLTISLFSSNTDDIKVTSKEKTIKATDFNLIDSLKLEEKGIDGLTKIGVISQDNNDTLVKILNEPKEINSKRIIDLGFRNSKELDSLRKKGSENIKANSIKYWFLKKWLNVEEERTKEEIFKEFSVAFSRNLPKVLFLYMPIFAFTLWLFHDKKKWYYFDHAIFTLHYFSFLLLFILVLFVIDLFKPLLSISPILGWIHFGLKTAGFIIILSYFFPAHRRFYGDKFFLSFFKSTLVYLINLTTFGLFLMLFSVYTYLNLN